MEKFGQRRRTDCCLLEKSTMCRDDDEGRWPETATAQQPQPEAKRAARAV